MVSWPTGNEHCLVMAAVTVFHVATDAAPSQGHVDGGLVREGFMMDTRRYTKTALDVHGKLHIRLHQTHDNNNSSWVGYIEDPRRASDDDIGALYYVVAVILIYGLSIVMMIASHIRKNKQDNQLRAYLKEMANLRKSDRREKVLSKMNDLANRQKTQDALEAKQKVLEKLKGAGEGDADKEVTQVLTKKDTNDDNTDSVFLPPDNCTTSPQQPRRLEPNVDKQGEVSSLRNSVSSNKSSLRMNSTGSNNSNVPSATTSPALSSCRHISTERMTSPSFHDYWRWKRAENRALSIQDNRTVRIQERLSPSPVEQRSFHSRPDSRSPGPGEFRLSTLHGRERSSTIHETRPSRWGRANMLSPNNARYHRNVEVKPPVKTGEPNLGLPASFYVVDEDAVL